LAREYPRLSRGYGELYPPGRAYAPAPYTARVRASVDREARRVGLKS